MIPEAMVDESAIEKYDDPQFDEEAYDDANADGDEDSSEDDEPAVNFRLEDDIDPYKQQERDEDDMDEEAANEAAGIPRQAPRAKRHGRKMDDDDDENMQEDY
jgi:hypothetical protein